MSTLRLSLLALAILPVTGCPAPADDSDTGTRSDAPFSGADGGPRSDAPVAMGTDAGGTDAGMATDAPTPPSRDVRCGDPVPEGATVPTLRAYSGGSCPMLVPGRNTITTSGRAREFLLVVPEDVSPDETLPVVVMWHYLGGSANSMLTNGRAQESANELRFIGIIPEKGGDVTIDIPFTDPIDMAWPYLEASTDARVTEELTFFDDMLACVAEAYSVDHSCVSSVGVSAGALWTSQLLHLRSDVLASAIVLSGGVGPASGFSLFDVRRWASSTRPVPTLLGWGGPMDQCAMNFETSSGNLERALSSQGSFVMECVHNCGHTAPPVEDTVAGLSLLYRFALDHPFWLEPGESPYHVRGMPSGTPEWCGLGVGSATPRAGACPSALESCPVPALGGF